MSAPEAEGAVSEKVGYTQPEETMEKREGVPRPATPSMESPTPEIEAKPPVTPSRKVDKPLPKEPLKTPRIKKKVPWKGKNIMILLPRDEERGLPGRPPKPLRQNEIEKMFASWEELGYGINGFDHVVDGYQPPGTDDSQSRESWPTGEDLVRERSEKTYKVTLPDLNAWRDYVNELQEAKLRALGVFMAEEEPPAPPSPDITDPSRQASAQYPSNPFSPPLPASSASSNQAALGYPYNQQQFGAQAAQSPGVTSPISFAGVNGKADQSPFQFSPPGHPQWSPMQGMNGIDSPSFANLSGMISPQSPFGIDGIQSTGSPASNVHQRQQSLIYSMVPHQQQLQLQQQQQQQLLQAMRGSPRLNDVAEADEDGAKSASKTPEPPVRNGNRSLGAEEDAEYHLEEQFRHQLEHDDYNPQIAEHRSHERQKSEQMQQVPEHFANEPGKPMVLHHPRPHSRGHSLTQNMFNGEEPLPEGSDPSNTRTFAPLHGIPESQKADEVHEVETNPSNLGTPNPNFDVSSPFGQHQRNFSTVSNPWSDAEPLSGHRRSNHGSRSSISKLNVNAPEFKFNPRNSLTSGQFNFGGTAFQPTPFQANPELPVLDDEDKKTSEDEPAVGPSDAQKTSSPKEDIPAGTSPAPIAAFTGLSETEGDSSSFAPGQSEFSFSSSGPKFRPDAPSFTPFQNISSPPVVGTKHLPRDSIFGNIRVDTGDIVKPARKSKAIPIIRPSSRASAQSPKVTASSDEAAAEDDDGRLADDSRAKRAKSQAPDGDDVPLFAEQPKDTPPVIVEEEEAEKKEPEPAADETFGDGDNVLPADTSMSSAATGDQVDTQATTAAPSESSPAEVNAGGWSSFEFNPKTSLSAAAEAFTPASQTADQESPAVEEAEENRAQSPTPQPKPSTPKGLGLGSSRFATPTSKPKGLSASRYASETFTSPADPAKDDSILDSVEQEPVPEHVEETVQEPLPEPVEESVEEPIHESIQEPVQESVISFDQPDTVRPSVEAPEEDNEQTFEQIDAIMQELGNDPSLGVNKTTDTPSRSGPVAEATNSPTYKLDPPHDHVAHHALASPPEYREVPEPTVPDLEEPVMSPVGERYALQPHSDEEAEEPHSPVLSDWENAFSADEHNKLESRAQFFDGRVNEVVGNLLASRLEPLEHALFSIQDALALKSGRPTSSRRDILSIVSEDRQQSDADDEDEEPVPRRSMSPRRDRRMDQIRAAVLESLAAHHRAQPTSLADKEAGAETDSVLAKGLAEVKELLAANTKPDFGGDELKSLIENAVERKMPPPPQPDVDLLHKMEGLQSRIDELQERLDTEKDKVEKETVARRSAEDTFADLHRQLQAAETRVEVEIINKSVFDQRVADLEERLRQQEAQTEEQVENRRQAEDRLSEVQRLLRIASEEETRLRDAGEEKDQRIKMMEQANAKTNMKMALLEASQNNSTQSQSELTNKLNVLEADLRDVRQDNNHWRAEAERSDEAARRNAGELAHTQEENKHLQKSLNTLTTQLEENERLRESWRSKFVSLQEDMARAAQEIAQENARRIKKDQTMLARQEVLDARLQAEAKTRERLEVEMERLQNNERVGIRATKECERLETLLGELRTENHELERDILQARRELDEAREIGASEVKRARVAVQAELDSANLQVNAVREELEEQNIKLRAELDNFKLEADTAKARSEMLLEEAVTSKALELTKLQKKNADEMEDVHAKYEQQRSVALEEAQKTEQNLLERLSFSASRIEHYEERIQHLEERLEISKEAAAAAAAAAKSAGVESREGAVLSAVTEAKAAPVVAPTSKVDLPEKISPQALRESIMVLQEQLQAREQRIEELEQTVAKSDPDAPNKISKRDDEISWLRELLAVRHADLQDIIGTLSSESFDRNRVKDATIRLKANLQMEEQERERAMNGGSAISLPNIAQTIQTATPKVAQTLQTAWGSWRKGSGSFSSIGGRLNSPSAGTRNATPSKPGPSQHNKALSGLMTPPASSIRQTPLVDNKPQPTAFGSTGRRFPSHGSASGPAQERRPSHTSSSRAAEKMPAEAEDPDSPHEVERDEPMTPPMMRSAVYDSDAQPGDFDDDDFFQDE